MRKLILAKEEKNLRNRENVSRIKESLVSNELAQNKKLNEELLQKTEECNYRMSLVDKKQEESG